MINLKDMSAWRPLEAGEVMEYRSRRPRPVKLEVNSDRPVALMIAIEGAPPQLLALVHGRETVAFVVAGQYQLMHLTEGATVWLYSADGTMVHRPNVIEEAFTRIHERKARDPELEYMMYSMNKNFERRMAQHAAELERKYGEHRGQGAGGAGGQSSGRDPGREAPGESAGGKAPKGASGSEGDGDASGSGDA